MKTDIIILDAKYFCHRFFGRKLHSEINGKVLRTEIPYGALTGMISFFTKYKPKYGFVLSWDGMNDDLMKRKIDKRYKKNRSAQEPTFYRQIEMLMDISKFIGIPQFLDNNWESDDIMGSLVKKRKDINWCIHTSDKDLYQAISKNTSILKQFYETKKYGLYGLKELKEDLDITPKQYYLMKLLTGCRGDNVEGVRGIGEKTALKIVKSCNSIDDIFNEINKCTPKIKKKIIEGKKIIELNTKLVNIKRNLKPHPLFKIKLINGKKLTNFMKKLRFNSMLRTHNFNCLLEINYCGIKFNEEKIWRKK